MSSLDERFDKEIEALAPTAFEVAGMQSNYKLAIKMGLAKGYAMAIGDAEDAIMNAGVEATNA